MFLMCISCHACWPSHVWISSSFGSKLSSKYSFTAHDIEFNPRSVSSHLSNSASMFPLPINQIKFCSATSLIEIIRFQMCEEDVRADTWVGWLCYNNKNNNIEEEKGTENMKPILLNRWSPRWLQLQKWWLTV